MITTWKILINYLKNNNDNQDYLLKIYLILRILAVSCGIRQMINHDNRRFDDLYKISQQILIWIS